MNKFIKNVVLGVVLGVFIGFVWSVVTSVLVGRGVYYPSSLEFMNKFQTTIDAVLVSAVLWALTGSLFSISSMIFEQTDWGITKATTVHFIVTLCGFMPIAILAGWLPSHLVSIIGFLLLFIVIYCVMWFIFMRITAIKVAELNEKLAKK